MKKIICFLCSILITILFCSCSNDTYSQENYNQEVTSSKEPTCDEVGHNYENGVCTRCGKITEIDMNQRVSKPTEFVYNRNSVGGMKVTWLVNNISGKTIKYAYFEFRFENSVGDRAYDEITGENGKSCRFTGPIEPNGEFGIIEVIVGYCNDCNKIILDRITLEYMDGNKEEGNYGWYTTLYV